MWALLLGGIGVAAALDVWAGHDWPIMTVLAIFGSFISYVSGGKLASLFFGFSNAFYRDCARHLRLLHLLREWRQ